MGRPGIPTQVQFLRLRLLCVSVVASVGVVGVIASAPQTMLAGLPHGEVKKQSMVTVTDMAQLQVADRQALTANLLGPLDPSLAEQAAEATLDTTVSGAAAAGPGVLGIPAPMLESYRRAATSLARTDPACHLPWWLLAGIGKIESNHARGGRVDAAGRTRGTILGPRLDGSLANTSVVSDSDNGRLDGDSRYDRAVGPMQFLPSTWEVWASDGNADHKSDPSNIYDASLAAGRYLCAGDADLATPSGLARAVLRYNPSGAYLRSVLAWAASYRDGARSVPGEPGWVGTGPLPPPHGSVPPLPGLPGPVLRLPPDDSTDGHGGSSGDNTSPHGPGTPAPAPTTPTPGPSGPSPTPPPPTKPPTHEPPDDPSPSPSPTKSTTPTPLPTHTTSPSPSPTPTPTPTPTCPSTSPTPSPSPTPTPSPSPSPSPDPTCPGSATGDDGAGPTPTPSPGQAQP